jgi:hypothetical protein
VPTYPIPSHPKSVLFVVYVSKTTPGAVIGGARVAMPIRYLVFTGRGSVLPLLCHHGRRRIHIAHMEESQERMEQARQCCAARGDSCEAEFHSGSVYFLIGTGSPKQTWSTTSEALPGEPGLSHILLRRGEQRLALLPVLISI